MDHSNRIAPSIEPGLVWHQVETGEWVEGVIRGDRFIRLAAVGEGLPLCDVTGAFIGPLPQPRKRPT